MAKRFSVGQPVKVYSAGFRRGDNWDKIGTITKVGRTYASVSLGSWTHEFDMASGAERTSDPSNCRYTVKTLEQAALDEARDAARDYLLSVGGMHISHAARTTIFAGDRLVALAEAVKAILGQEASDGS